MGWKEWRTSHGHARSSRNSCCGRRLLATTAAGWHRSCRRACHTLHDVMPNAYLHAAALAATAISFRSRCRRACCRRGTTYHPAFWPLSTSIGFARAAGECMER